ncbi:MAG: gamma-glutamylcyclotransferase family protein [Rectinemataceae bacterium]|nr:gamma-glutamylcyclotransferase family protein [Rectinemataceae bacterium]
MFCFSYGSNMSLARLRERVPSAKFVAVASLAGHRLKFHKVSSDGSGKCDAASTGNPRDCVLGVVFEISDSEKPALDQKEGLGSGYDEKDVKVVTAEEKTLRSKMYFATEVDSSLKPYHWYKEHVLVGARDNHLPAEYVKQIEAVDTNDDPDRERCERELAIYL